MYYTMVYIHISKIKTFEQMIQQESSSCGIKKINPNDDDHQNEDENGDDDDDARLRLCFIAMSLLSVYPRHRTSISLVLCILL